ncbi:putative nucleic acid-binding protein [Roseospira visakhapatnamensis]|uniref:Putative nucleic acid-binding protein n=1 Tax=Roseospira visakhapatnamensis TaxID=390880 RepID=A0A7W6REW7_9PROT|nr:putative nucleic acid-binding protein [Roseospira visakhapatnamensis]
MVYTLASDPEKAGRARRLIVAGGTISVQVLNEAANVPRRKRAMEWPDITAWLSVLRESLTVVPVTVETHDLGLWLAERHCLSPFDAMIVAAAVLADCDTLWSEDMHDGLVVLGRVRIVNPFRSP